MSFLDDIKRIQDAKKSLYELLIANGAIVEENTKLDKYPNVISNLLKIVDNAIQYGYIDNNGDFQKINLNSEPVINDGQSINFEAVLYKLPDIM